MFECLYNINLWTRDSIVLYKKSYFQKYLSNQVSDFSISTVKSGLREKFRNFKTILLIRSPCNSDYEDHRGFQEHTVV